MRPISYRFQDVAPTYFAQQRARFLSADCVKSIHPRISEHARGVAASIIKLDVQSIANFVGTLEQQTRRVQ